MIHLEHIHATYNGQPVLTDVSLHLERGECAALVGPNGAGKSSLLRVITGQLPSQGSRRIAGGDPARCNAREFARHVAVVPQELPQDISFAAYEFVLLGRTAYLPRFGSPSKADHDAVQEAMNVTGTWHLRHRALTAMSGGERQRLAIAVALAAQPEILLLDEPTSHLDLRHRVDLMALLLRLNRDGKITILMVVHDLTLASQFFSRIILLNQGVKLADGTPAEVLRPDLLEAAYGCPINVIPLPDFAAACVLPVRA